MTLFTPAALLDFSARPMETKGRNTGLPFPSYKGEPEKRAKYETPLSTSSFMVRINAENHLLAEVAVPCRLSSMNNLVIVESVTEDSILKS